MSGEQNQSSHLFMVRLWSDAVEDHKGWRGRVQHVLSGETHTFHDWSTLVDLFLEMAETDQVAPDRIEAEQPDRDQSM